MDSLKSLQCLEKFLRALEGKPQEEDSTGWQQRIGQQEHVEVQGTSTEDRRPHKQGETGPTQQR